MLREDGFVMDDGTVARLAPERFVMMSTTANAVRTMQHLEFCRQVLWPALRRAAVSRVGAMASLRSRAAVARRAAQADRREVRRQRQALAASGARE
jgi:sarcosine oxidase subunit alpha